MQLPKPPMGLAPDVQAYVETLVRELERELDRRPARQAVDGVLYLGNDLPVSLISPNGTAYRLTVGDDGALITTVVS